LDYLSASLFPNSQKSILFWEFYFIPFSVHAQTNTIQPKFVQLVFNTWNYILKSSVPIFSTPLLSNTKFLKCINYVRKLLSPEHITSGVVRDRHVVL
jgi:hypothetical protein